MPNKKKTKQIKEQSSFGSDFILQVFVLSVGCLQKVGR